MFYTEVKLQTHLCTNSDKTFYWIFEPKIYLYFQSILSCHSGLNILLNMSCIKKSFRQSLFSQSRKYFVCTFFWHNGLFSDNDCQNLKGIFKHFLYQQFEKCLNCIILYRKHFQFVSNFSPFNFWLFFRMSHEYFLNTFHRQIFAAAAIHYVCLYACGIYWG
jgi:hypothetical protein